MSGSETALSRSRSVVDGKKLAAAYGSEAALSRGASPPSVVRSAHSQSDAPGARSTTGASRFARITHPYYRVSQGVLLVYDASDPEGLMQAAAWLDSVAQYAPASCSIVLVGAKADLLSEDERALRTSEAVGVARSRGVRLHTLTSARTGTGVVEAFGMLVREIRYQAQQPAAARQQPLVVRSGADSAPWCSPGCCAPVVGCCLPYWPWSQPSRTPLVHAGRHSHVAAAAHVEMGSRMVAGATIV